ncbi:hypothetical protein BT96DRAFT_838210 [Gymnopus androsaceus JB14]|uniref:hAT-like transposase RNase-H fold domain-containing protein n=1 Tax=Gymnopus androsaceus JB14 TaxID=1447944 RepID=A0A6A4GNN3_9AGAR|nr:hypothetical protein BT96DRAFT_838210 [Gymnopus androsaceus JB14]
MLDLVLAEAEWEAIEGLVSALKILKDATLFFSSNSPNIATVIPTMDAINEAFATGIIDNQLLSEPIRHALSVGKRTLNKYYALTDDSDIYCMVMVLHPSLKLEYFRKAGWTDDWVQDAVDITWKAWEHRYKPAQPIPASQLMVHLHYLFLVVVFNGKTF